MIVFVEALYAGTLPPENPPADPGTVFVHAAFVPEGIRFGDVSYVTFGVGC